MRLAITPPDRDRMDAIQAASNTPRNSLLSSRNVASTPSNLESRFIDELMYPRPTLTEVVRDIQDRNRARIVAQDGAARAAHGAALLTRSLMWSAGRYQALCAEAAEAEGWDFSSPEKWMVKGDTPHYLELPRIVGMTPRSLLHRMSCTAGGDGNHELVSIHFLGAKNTRGVALICRTLGPFGDPCFSVSVRSTHRQATVHTEVCSSVNEALGIAHNHLVTAARHRAETERELARRSASGALHRTGRARGRR